MKDVSYAYDKAFASIINYKDIDFLPDSSQIVYISDQDGQFNLWKQKFDFNDKINSFDSQVITHFTNDSIRAAFPSKIKNEIVFFADKDGNQNYQIYRIKDISDIDIELLTQNYKARHEWGPDCYSHGEQFIIYSSNKNNPDNILIYTHDLDKSISECIINKQGWFTPGYWSYDDKFINCIEQKTLSRI